MWYRWIFSILTFSNLWSQKHLKGSRVQGVSIVSAKRFTSLNYSMTLSRSMSMLLHTHTKLGLIIWICLLLSPEHLSTSMFRVLDKPHSKVESVPIVKFGLTLNLLCPIECTDVWVLQSEPQNTYSLPSSSPGMLLPSHKNISSLWQQGIYLLDSQGTFSST